MTALKANHAGMLNGIIFVVTVAFAATYLAQLALITKLGISPLVIGIIIGICYANTLHNHFPKSWCVGIHFSATTLLRIAIAFYGFRITFQQLAEVGFTGFLISFIMITTTFCLGTLLGHKVFKMDKDTAMLTAAGASICGAAAVLATEPVLKAEEHKVSVAVSMVVLFGTIAMFLYPMLYSAGLFPSMNERTFGIFAGGTIHEVAQVVAVSSNYSKEASDAAIIVKMTRVLMLAPMLLILGCYLSLNVKKTDQNHQQIKLVIPWFSIYFISIAGANSLIQYYLTRMPEYTNVVNIVIDSINYTDTFLLTMAMSALGMGTRLAKFKVLGLAPIYTAGAMFLWLMIGGYFITLWIV